MAGRRPRTLELALNWLYSRDRSLKRPYQNQLSALIFEPTFREVAGADRFSKAQVIQRHGNAAAHGKKPILQYDALTSVRELFQLTFHVSGGPSDFPEGISRLICLATLD